MKFLNSANLKLSAGYQIIFTCVICQIRHSSDVSSNRTERIKKYPESELQALLHLSQTVVSVVGIAKDYKAQTDWQPSSLFKMDPVALPVFFW